jgi:hypothetical protein
MTSAFRQKVWALWLFPFGALGAQEAFVLPTQAIDEALERAEWVAQAAGTQGLGFFLFQQQWPAREPLPATTFTLPNTQGSFDLIWGAWDQQQFVPAFRLQPTDSGLVSGSFQLDELQTALLPYGRLADSLLSHDPRFKEESLDRFVRHLPNNRVEVFCLPPYNPSTAPVYGKYVHLVFDRGTGKVISESFLNGTLQEIPPQPTEALVLSSEARDMPSAAAYAFAWMYRKSFADIKLETAVMVSVLTRKKTGEWVWMHARKKAATPALPAK